MTYMMGLGTKAKNQVEIYFERFDEKSPTSKSAQVNIK